ncbi:hypothetical protein [uncultured Streptomyces sp.]|nr:hypothetical protein [uncultured Streptomyces sp.]
MSVRRSAPAASSGRVALRHTGPLSGGAGSPTGCTGGLPARVPATGR